jgi:hypothetical protein
MVVDTNIDVRVDRVFRAIPVHVFDDPPDTKNKPKLRAFIAAQNLPDGTIVAMEWERQLRGLSVKHFLNAMTIMMVIQNKYINFKIPAKGRIQITGCARDELAELCIQHLLDALRRYSTPEEPLYEMRGDARDFTAVFRVVLSNRNFKLGFLVNRQSLDRYVNTQSELQCSSAIEETFGYAGLKIKFPYTRHNIPLTTLTYRFGADGAAGAWTRGFIPYDEFLKTLSPKEYMREVDKTRKNSFMIFQSGSSIMSGCDAEHMRAPYYAFMEMIQRCRKDIEYHPAEDTRFEDYRVEDGALVRES